MNWENTKVLVTGGASFIGSHLTDRLVARGAQVRIVDDLSAGRIENIQHLIDDHKVEFILADLREPGISRSAVSRMDAVFQALIVFHQLRKRPPLLFALPT